VIHSLTANIGQFGNIVTALFIYLFEGRMFSLRMVTNLTSARETLHCRKTRIPCGDQFVICGLYYRLRENGSRYEFSVWAFIRNFSNQ
jgi:hypothetical protein